jgi:signal transduction histidine kinase
VAAREGRPLTVTVENGPADGDGAELRSSGGGFGLAGLRERIAAIDGNLDAGPTPDGGWRVVARVPVRSGTRVSAQT